MASAASSSVGSFYSIQASRLQRRSKDKPNRSSAVTDNVLQPHQLYDNQRNHTSINRGSNFDKDGYTSGVLLAAEDYHADSASEKRVHQIASILVMSMYQLYHYTSVGVQHINNWAVWHLICP